MFNQSIFYFMTKYVQSSINNLCQIYIEYDSRKLIHINSSIVLRFQFNVFPPSTVFLLVVHCTSTVDWNFGFHMHAKLLEDYTDCKYVLD